MTIYRPTVAQEMGGDHSINKAVELFDDDSNLLRIVSKEGRLLVKTPVNPLLQWLNMFFSRRSLSGADGRALYAYRCTDTEYESLAELLRTYAPRNYPRTIFISYSDVLFSIYAAEFIRRTHTVGHRLC